MKLVSYYLLYFIIGFIIFNVVYSLVKVTFINYLGANEAYLSVFLLGFKDNFIIYFILYLLFISIDNILKRIIIFKLNQKLEDIARKEGKNEK